MMKVGKVVTKIKEQKLKNSVFILQQTMARKWGKLSIEAYGIVKDAKQEVFAVLLSRPNLWWQA